MPSAGFEPAILTIKRFQNYVLGRTATGMPPNRITHGKSPRYPLNRRPGGPERRSGRFGEEENPLTLPEAKTRSKQQLGRSSRWKQSSKTLSNWHVKRSCRMLNRTMFRNYYRPMTRILPMTTFETWHNKASRVNM